MELKFWDQILTDQIVKNQLICKPNQASIFAFIKKDFEDWNLAWNLCRIFNMKTIL
jgi:hypothetical protein